MIGDDFTSFSNGCSKSITAKRIINDITVAPKSVDETSRRA